MVLGLTVWTSFLMRQRFGCEGVVLHQADVHLAELLSKSLSALEMEAKVSQSPSHHLKSLVLFFASNKQHQLSSYV